MTIYKNENQEGHLQLSSLTLSATPWNTVKHHESLCCKSHFETYKSYDHMQKNRPTSQNFNEILAFENLKKMRFCHTLPYENRRNWLHFLDTGLIFWI